MSFISALNNFAQGLDPTVTRLILGDFEFLGFEVPIRLAFPGKQKTVIHQMIGGKRTIDVLGTEYDPLTWTGIITGAQSNDRVMALERMRDAGDQVIMTLDGYSFTVVITSFTPSYDFIYRRPYTIEVAVVSRNDSPLRVDALTGALDALVNSDVGKALGLSDIINIQSVTDAVTGALQDFIAGLSLGQLLPFTQLATIAYGASPLVTNVSSVTLNGSTSDLAASAKQVIRAGTITVS